MKWAKKCHGLKGISRYFKCNLLGFMSFFPWDFQGDHQQKWLVGGGLVAIWIIFPCSYWVGMSSSQLTKSIIFQRGGEKTPTRMGFFRLFYWDDMGFLMPWSRGFHDISSVIWNRICFFFFFNGIFKGITNKSRSKKWRFSQEKWCFQMGRSCQGMIVLLDPCPRCPAGGCLLSGHKHIQQISFAKKNMVLAVNNCVFEYI